MKKIFVLLLFLFVSSSCSFAEITNYEPVNFQFETKKTIFIITRRFEENGVKTYLIVNTKTFKTEKRLTSEIKNLKPLDNYFHQTRFGRALSRFTKMPVPLQNCGLTKAETMIPNALYLTVDMCPSTKNAFEEDFFLNAMEQPYVNAEGFPVAICLTGRWLKAHPIQFAQLLDWQKEKKLDITWVNHSLTHFYDPLLPLNQKFVLKEGTDFYQEVLEMEKLFLENKVLPSVFFRFPGLVADNNVVDALNKLKLIPLGSNTWLAKGEIPVTGSIILVHGNLNEPKGIKLAMAFFDNLKETHFKFYPLEKAVN